MNRLPWSALAIGVLASCDPATEGEASPAATAGESRQHPWDWVPDEPQLARGREVYLSECALCHNEGEESAPRLADAAEWAHRAAQGDEVLIRHATEGFFGEAGEMPARGGTPDLPDADVAAAVRYMVAAASVHAP